VETPEENDFLKNVIDVTDSNMPYSYSYWVLGGKSRINSTEYVWVQTGNQITWSDWAGGEPDYSYNSYIYMSSRNENRKWNDLTYYSSPRSIICEAKGEI
jgi:hypothetical protein